MPATTLVAYCMTAEKCAFFFSFFVSWDKMQYLGNIRGADVQLCWCENAFEYRQGLAQLRLNRNSLGWKLHF